MTATFVVRHRDAGYFAVELQFGLATGQQIGDFFGGLKTVFGFLREQFRHDRDEPVGNLWQNLLQRTGRVFDHSTQDGDGVGRSERRAATGHLVQHTPEAEQVGAMIQRLTGRLLRSHVHRRAGDDSRPRHAGIVRRACQAEVADLHTLLGTLFEQNVGRLDVTMDQSHRLCSRQTAGDLPPDMQHFGSFERAASIELVVQRLAIDELHHQVRQRLLLDAVNLHDVLMPNSGGRTSFSQKTLPRRRRRGQLRIHHLDCDQPMQLLVKRLEDDPERPLAKHAQDFVMSH